jgi:hypothetical protein
MTAYFISSANSISQTAADVDGQDLVGGDTLVIAGDGWIYALGGGDAINAAGPSANLVTVDGLAYSDEAAAIAVSSPSTNVTVDGMAQGDQGVAIYSADVVVDVGREGEIDGFTGSASFAGVGVLIHTPTVPAARRAGVKPLDSPNQAKDETVNNDGDIVGAVAGVDLDASNGGNAINNSGTISGVTGILATGESAADSVVNSGTISGATTGVSYTGGVFGLSLANAGVLSGGTAILLSNGKGEIDTIENSGRLTGSAGAIVADDDRVDVNNSGIVHGALITYNGATVDVENEGDWIRSQFGPVFSLNAAGDLIENSGLVQGAIGLDSGKDVFNNSGTILGYITFAGSGTGDALTNSGGITGNVAMSANSETLINTGAIVGAVDLSGAKSVITNRGEISDSVTLGAHSTLTNTGIISGNLTLGASDVANLGKGDVAGKIEALAGGDTLEFGAGFGHETIEFAPTTTKSVTHDVFEFQTDAFADYALVQKAMTQVGANVIIRLDADDTLLVDKTTVSSLVAADFKFF